MIATTATRKATDTMMPSRVKKERSLWFHASWSASRAASEKGMEPASGGFLRLRGVGLHFPDVGTVLQIPDRLIRAGRDDLTFLQPLQDFEVFVAGDADADRPEGDDALLDDEHALCDPPAARHGARVGGPILGGQRRV